MAPRWGRSTRLSCTISAAAGCPPRRPAASSRTDSAPRSWTACGSRRYGSGSTGWCGSGSGDARRRPPPGRFPAAGAAGERSPARLSRQRGDDPEAAGRARRHHRVLPDHQRQRASRGLRPRDSRHGSVRGGALERRPRIVAFAYVANALGTVNPAAQLARLAHAAGAVVVVDGAQSTPHLKVDVQTLDCDFYALSGHKMLGPMGSGALVAKPELLDAMPPYHGGGEMISRVWDDHSTYNKIPHKFEAGTPYDEDAVGRADARSYRERIGRR